MADSSVIGVQDVNKMKVADLKRELKLRGLNTSGNKTELIERLTTLLESDDSKLEAMSSEDLMEDVLNEDDLDEDIEDVEEVEKDLLDHSLLDRREEEPQILPLKRKISEDNATKAPPRKIVLNRALSVSAPAKETLTPQVEIKPDEVKPVSTKVEITMDKTESTEDKRVVKLSNLSVKERLEMRAKKFGAPLPDDLKKVARSARFGIDSSSEKTSNSISVAAPAKLDVLKKRAERFGSSVSSVMSKLDTQERLERRKARFGSANTTTTVK